MDSIGNLLTSIRNAELAAHDELTTPYTTVSERILGILKESDYITGFSVVEEGGRKKLHITLPAGHPRHHYKRVSKPGRRIYTNAKSIPLVLRGLGMVILSTPEGVMSGQEAKKRNIGGEVLCELY